MAFNASEVQLKSGENIHFINIENIDNDLKELIDLHLVEICDSEAETDIAIIKRDLQGFFRNKSRSVEPNLAIISSQE